MKNKDGKFTNFLQKFKVAKVKIDPQLAGRFEEFKLGEIVKEGNTTYVYINNKKDIKVLAPNKKAFEKLLDLFFIEEIPWIKESIAGENSLVLEHIKRPKDFIKELAPHISGEDYGALSYAYAIMIREDKNIDTLEMDKQLIDAYGGRGKRIYSLLRSGILENEIWPLIKDLGREEIIKKFDEIINSPPSLFIGKWMKRKDVEAAITKKIDEGYSDFPIFARAGKVKIAIDAIKEMAKKDKHIVYYIEEDDPIGKDDAVTIHFFKLD